VARDGILGGWAGWIQGKGTIRIAGKRQRMYELDEFINTTAGAAVVGAMLGLTTGAPVAHTSQVRLPIQPT